MIRTKPSLLLLLSTCWTYRWFFLASVFLAINAFWAASSTGLLQLNPSNPSQKPPATLQLLNENELTKRVGITWKFAADITSGEDIGVWLAQSPAIVNTTTGETIEGKWRWKSSRELLFQPLLNWNPGHEIAIEFNPDRFPEGTPAFETNWTLATPRLALTKSWLSLHEEEVHLHLNFNTEVNPTQLKTQFQLSTINGDAFTLTPTETEPTKTPTFQIATQEFTSGSARLHLNADLLPAQGTRGLAREHIQTLVLEDAFAIRYTNIDTGFTDVRINLYPSRHLAGHDLKSFIHIEPDVPFQVHNHGHRLTLHGPFPTGQSVTITFRKGTPTTNKQKLHAPLERMIWIPARKPNLVFRTTGSYLSPRGNLRLPVQQVNLQQAELHLARIYDNNVVAFAQNTQWQHYSRYAHQGLSQTITRKALDFNTTESNETQTTRIHLASILGPTPRPGVYHLDLSYKSTYRRTTSQLLVISDIGLSTRRTPTELIVWAHSIHDLTPLPNTRVTAISATRQPLAQGTTNADGLCRLPISEIPDEALTLLTATRGDDQTFLVLNAGKATLPRAGWRPFHRNGLEGFLFSDRDLVRPGESTQVKAIVREAFGAVPSPSPVQLTVLKPDGQTEFIRHATLNDHGTCTFNLSWSDTAPLGERRLLLHVPGTETTDATTTFARHKLRVEEFVPAQLELDTRIKFQDDNVRCVVSARNLTGGSTTGLEGLKTSAVATLRPTPFSPTDFTDFQFKDSEIKVDPKTQRLGTVQLDADGQASHVFTASTVPSLATAYELEFRTDVLEPGGRTASRRTTTPLHLASHYIGIRRLTRQTQGPTAPQTFEVVRLTPDGKLDPIPHTLLARLHLVSHSTHFEEQNGRYRLKQSRSLTELDDHRLPIKLENGRATFDLHPKREGDLLLRVLDPDTQQSTTIEWYAGQRAWYMYATDSNNDDPTTDALQLNFDRDLAHPGDTVHMTLRTPFTGRALLTLESDRVIESRSLLISNAVTETSWVIPPLRDPSISVTASLIRSPKPGLLGAYRAVGRASLRLDPSHRKLNIQLTAPEHIKPRETLTVSIQTTTTDGHPTPAEITLVAVDEGICQLTEFNTPDPLGWFTATRQPDLQHADHFGLLMPEFDLTDALKTGGDGEGRYQNLFKAKRFKTVSLVRELQTDATGKTTVELPIPEFTGTLRLYAVAVADARFGHAERRLDVHRPFSILPALPRFAATGDRFQVPLTLQNNSDEPQSIQLQLATTGPIEITEPPQNHNIPPNTSSNLLLTASASQAPGIATISLHATTETDEYKESIPLSIRPPVGLRHVQTALRLEPGTTLDLPLGHPFIPETAKARLSVHPSPLLQVSGDLKNLLRYPHGCLEQTSSAAYGVLATAQLAPFLAPDLIENDHVESYMIAAINRVLSFQNQNGGFGWWADNRSNLSCTTYALEFLIEAKEAGYQIPHAAIETGSAFLKNRCRSGHSSQSIAALYLLAKSGQLHGRESLLRRATETIESLGTIEKIILAQAWLHTGNRREAIAAYNTQTTPHNVRTHRTSTALIDARRLHLLAELHPGSPETAQAAQRVTAEAKLYNTRENVRRLLAISAYARTLPKNDQPIIFNVHGTHTNQLNTALNLETSHTINHQSPDAGPLFVTLEFTGIPSTPAPDHNHELAVRRSYIDPITNAPITPGQHLQQGDLIHIQLTIDPGEQTAEDIVLQDLLPAGLEPDWDPRHKIKGVRHAEKRDDRILVYFDTLSSKKTITYPARAVTPGRYTVPPVQANGMYDLSRSSQSTPLHTLEILP